MPDDFNNSLQQLWQAQPVEGATMSIEEIARRAGTLDRQITYRNLREYLAALLVTVFFGYSFVRAHEILFRAAFVVWIAGLSYMSFQLHRKGAARLMPSDMGASSCLKFYRSELERQRNILADVWPWYLAPLVPGFAVYTLAFCLTNPHWWSIVGMAVMDGVAAAVFIGIWKLNARAARSLQKRIDELNRTEGPC
jgi:hypothetical protein